MKTRTKKTKCRRRLKMIHDTRGTRARTTRVSHLTVRMIISRMNGDIVVFLCYCSLITSLNTKRLKTRYNIS